MRTLRGNRDFTRTPSPFAEGETRTLKVVVDRSHMEKLDGTARRQADLLLGLLECPQIEWLQYAEPRSGEDASQVTEGSLTAVAVDYADGSDVTHEVHYRYPKRGSTMAGISGDVGRGEKATWDTTYAEFGPSAAAHQRHEDSVVLGAALAAHADLFVTDRPFLLQGEWSFSQRLNVAPVHEALAMVAHFLRSRGVYVAWATPGNGHALHFDRDLYFWVAARAALPEGWRWHRHLNASGSSTGRDTGLLGASTFQRITRVLRSRDSLVRHLSVPQNSATAEDALWDMDTIMLSLMGAFDATARVAHRALAIPDREWRAGWQRDQWLREVSLRNPALSALLTPASEAADTLVALGALRNTVHGAALQSVSVQRLGGGKRERETAVQLPHDQAVRLLQVLDRHGWGGQWGIDSWGDDQFLVNPGLVVEHLLTRSLCLLNQLMAATPVVQLQGSDGVPVSHHASKVRSDHDPFSARHQESLRWQLGLFGSRPDGGDVRDGD